MNRSFPIPSRRAERAPRTAVAPTAGRALVALLLALGAGGVAAHESAEQVLPAQTGVKASAAVGLVSAHADEAVPAASLPGVLATGVVPQDQRDHPLEHATLQAGARWHPQWTAALGWGWHGSERAHTELAWLQWQRGAHLARAGRQTVERGAVISEAGHFDRFLQAPLATRAVFDGDWLDDGLQWRWTPDPAAESGATFDLGLWRNQRFPGSPASPASLHLHPQYRWEDLTIDAFAARAKVRARGQYLQSPSGAHTHAVPDCRVSLAQLACFDGWATLAGASLRWQPDHGPWTVSSAWLMRRESGNLYTVNGDTRYRGRTQGGWVDLQWQPASAWTTALRLERLVPTHDLSGVGATLVATDTALSATATSTRQTAMLGWSWHPAVLLALEAGREDLGQAPSRRFAAVRLSWRGSVQHAP